MENGTGQKPRRHSAQRLEARRTMGGMLLAMTPLWALFPSLGLLLMVLSPSFTGWLLAGAEADAPALAYAWRARRRGCWRRGSPRWPGGAWGGGDCWPCWGAIWR